MLPSDVEKMILDIVRIDAAATKIQATFRGFHRRKWLRCKDIYNFIESAAWTYRSGLHEYADEQEREKGKERREMYAQIEQAQGPLPTNSYDRLRVIEEWKKAHPPARRSRTSSL